MQRHRNQRVTISECSMQAIRHQGCECGRKRHLPAELQALNGDVDGKCIAQRRARLAENRPLGLAVTANHAWREWRRERLSAGFAVAVVPGQQLAAMNADLIIAAGQATENT